MFKRLLAVFSAIKARKMLFSVKTATRHFALFRRKQLIEVAFKVFGRNVFRYNTPFVIE